MPVWKVNKSDLKERTFGVQAGMYECKIAKLEEKKGAKGQYLALEVECTIDGSMRTMYLNLFHTSEAENLKSDINDLLTVIGVEELNSWQDIVGKQYVALCRGEQEMYKDEVKVKFAMHSIYNTQFKTPIEMSTNSDPVKYKENHKWVVDNPLKKLRSEVEAPF